LPETPVKFSLGYRESSAEMAKMRKRKRAPKLAKISVDGQLGKKRRGRPGANVSEVVLRAENYRRMFWTSRLRGKKEHKKWVRDQPYEWSVALVAADTTEDATSALDTAPSHVQSELKPLVPLILQVLQEHDFPKRPENQFDFLAESLAARGEVSPRRSRDICTDARAAERNKSPYKILRTEFYVECSCGYEGPARNNACRKCGAVIPIGLEDLL
jgi:hypothetical protein